MPNSINHVRKLEVNRSLSNRIFRFGLAVLGFELFSGSWLLIEKGLSIRVMSLVLGHTLLGYFLLISLVMFLQRHRLYRKAWPSKQYDAIAAYSLITLVTALGTGIWIHWFGFAGRNWIRWTHIIASFGHILGLIGYISFTLKNGYTEENTNIRKAFTKQVLKIAASVCVLFVVILSGFEYFNRSYQLPTSNKVIPDYTKNLANWNVFYPSRFKTESKKFYKEEHFTNSRSCGTTGCHEETTRQWNDSTHYRTPGPFVQRVRDLLIQEGNEDKLLAHAPSTHLELIRKSKPGREVFRMCASCHAPVALLSGNVDPKAPLERFETHEGVSCKLCHTMSETPEPIHGPGEYEVTAPPRLLFEDSNDPIRQHFYETLIRTRPEDHKNMFMKPGYKNSAICSSCHYLNQYKEWAKSKYNHAGSANAKNCQSCHMPQVKTNQDVSAATKGTVADHRYLSAGLTMADYHGLKEQFEKTKQFLQDKKLEVKILIPNVVSKNKTNNFIVRTFNTGVGHNYPAGPEIDLVESWIQIDVLNEENKVIYQFGTLDENNMLDQNKNHIWRGYNHDANGKPLENDRHRSWLFAKDTLYVINPDQYSDVQFTLPSQVTRSSNKITIQARLIYRRPNQQFADWVFGKGKYKVPHIVVAQNTITTQVSTNKKDLEESNNNYKARLHMEEPGFTKMSPEPIIGYRNVISDSVLLENAVYLDRNGKPEEALILLNAVSPIVKNYESGFQKKYFELMEDISKKVEMRKKEDTKKGI